MVAAAKKVSPWHYVGSGDAGHEPLILLHGFTGSGGMWSEIVASLDSDFYCIAPDLPGHGETMVPDDIANYRMPRVADMLAEFAESLGLRQAIVWGYSMGGRLALLYTTLFPGRVSRLILESASPGLADATVRQERKESDDRLAAEIESNGIAAFVEQWEAHPLFERHRALPEPKQAQMRAIRLANKPEGLALSLRGMGTGTHEPLHERLAEIQVPTLILAGEHDEKFRLIGRHMAETMPSATYRVVPKAGHTTFWEQPEACLRIVRPFLHGEEPPDLLPSGK